MGLPDRAGHERVGDPEREQVVEVLRVHCAEGRLDLEEFGDRVGDVWRARTRAELDQLTADLPALPDPPPPELHPAERPAPRRLARRWAVGVLSGNRVRGRWLLDDHVHAVAVVGHCQLDLCDADVVGDEVTVYVVTFLGGVEVLVPEGVPVEVGGVALIGSIDERVRKTEPLPGMPLVRVRAFCLLGGATVRSHRMRRGLRRP